MTTPTDAPEVALKIQPGAVRVNSGVVRRAGTGVVALEVDLHSKYAEVSCTGSGEDAFPAVYLAATEDTLKLDDAHERDSLTMVQFTDYRGWHVHSCGVGRYTLSVCLVSPEDA